MAQGENDLAPPQIQNGGAGSAPTTGRVTAPDYRQLQPAEEIDVRSVDRAADAMGDAGERQAAALGNLFKQFEGAGTDVLNKVAGQSGQVAGAAAGMSSDFKPRTGLQAATTYGAAYNAAAHQTYITSTQLSLEKQLTDIESANTGNPDAFQTQAGAAVQGALKNMDPLYQPEMTNWAQARIQAGVNRQNQQKSEDVRNTSLATYQSSTPDLITGALHTAAALPGPAGDAVITKLVQDDQDKLNALVSSHTITPEQAVSMHQKMIADTHSQMSGQKVDISLRPILDTMKTDVEAADKLISVDDPNLTPEQNQVRQQEFEKDRAEWVRTQTNARVDDLNSAHQALAAGSYGPQIESQIRSLYKQGALSQEGYFSALAESIRNQKAALEDEASLHLVDAAVHGDGPRLDPKDPDSKAAADKYFQTHVAQAGTVSPEQYAMGAAEFTRQTGIVPASVQSQIRIGILSGDPTQTAQAAALAARIRDVNPEAEVFVGTPRLAALAGLVNDNLKAGLAPSQALSNARAQVEISPEQKKVRDQHYAADVKQGGGNNAALQSALQSQDGHFWNHAPQAPIAMQASYDSLVRQFYTQTGDIAKSRDIAAAQLRQTWGVSKVNGTPEYTQYPVKDSDVPTVRADIASSVKAAGYQGDPSEVHLTPNAYTDASQGRSWTLTHADPQTGATDVLLDHNNRPLRYDLPSPQDFAKNQAALAAQKIAAAKAQRDQERADSVDASRFEWELSSHYLGKIK